MHNPTASGASILNTRNLADWDKTRPSLFHFYLLAQLG